MPFSRRRRSDGVKQRRTSGVSMYATTSAVPLLSFVLVVLAASTTTASAFSCNHPHMAIRSRQHPTTGRIAGFDASTHRHVKQRRYSASTSTALAALVPLRVAEVEAVLNNGQPTGAQYAAYWGRTSRERYARGVGQALVSILGMCSSYFLSFVIGGEVATILGALFLFWAVLSPQLQAYQRNWELLGGRPLVDDWNTNDSPPSFWKEGFPWSSSDRDDRDEDDEEGRGRGLYAALWMGRLVDVCVVEDASSMEEYDLAEFRDYSMETDELEAWTGEPYLLRLRLEDAEDRELQIHARLSEEYVDALLFPDQSNEDDDLTSNPPWEGLAVTLMLLSKNRRMNQLAALTDLYIPAVDCWVGDYPYIERSALPNLLWEDDELWETLQQEGRLSDSSLKRLGWYNDASRTTNSLSPDDEDDWDSERIRVPRRHRRGGR